MKKIFILFLFFCLYSFQAYSKIRIFLFQYNRPDLLELQIKTINKFLIEKDVEIIVISDAVDPVFKKKIEEVSKLYGAYHINYPQELHFKGKLVENMLYWQKICKSHDSCRWFKAAGHPGYHPSVRHCQLVQYALQNFGYNHDDIIGLLEGDVFLINKFSIRDCLKNYDIAGVIRNNEFPYFWIGLIFINIPKLPNKETLNFDVFFTKKGNQEKIYESGGNTYNYIQSNPKVTYQSYKQLPMNLMVKFDELQLKKLNFEKKEINLINQIKSNSKSNDIGVSPYCEFHFNNCFFHLGSGRVDYFFQNKTIFKFIESKAN